MPLGTPDCCKSDLAWLNSLLHVLAPSKPAPEKILATLLPGPLACCRWELEQRRMTPPSNFILRIIVEKDPKLVRTLNTHYASATADGGLEPAERDALSMSLADTTLASRGLALAAWTPLGGSWPTPRTP